MRRRSSLPMRTALCSLKPGLSHHLFCHPCCKCHVFYILNSLNLLDKIKAFFLQCKDWGECRGCLLGDCEENLSEHPGWQLGSQCCREWSPGVKKIEKVNNVLICGVKRGKIGVDIGIKCNSR